MAYQPSTRTRILAMDKPVGMKLRKYLLIKLSGDVLISNRYLFSGQ